MPAKKTRKTRAPKTPAQNAEEIARKIWLAGVGAYGEAIGAAGGARADVKKSLDRLAADASGLFDELVKRGTAVESEVRNRIASSQATAEVLKIVQRARAIGDEGQDLIAAAPARVRGALKDAGSFLTLGKTVKTLERRVRQLESSAAKTPVRKPARKRPQASA